jgi:hypothetical protein
MMSESEDSRIERLVSLCKLWGAVKYFHPYLAYREDIDWDAALVSALPKVNAANSAGEYAAAVQSMLLALGDPATRVIEEVDNGTASSERERQPTFTTTPDDILVVTIHHYEDLTDFHGVGRKWQPSRRKYRKRAAFSSICAPKRLCHKKKAGCPMPSLRVTSPRCYRQHPLLLRENVRACIQALRHRQGLLLAPILPRLKLSMGAGFCLPLKQRTCQLFSSSTPGQSFHLRRSPSRQREKRSS